MDDPTSTREDICKFINSLDDKRLYKMGKFIDWCNMETIGNMNSGVMDSQFVQDTEELIFLIWDCSTQAGKLQGEFENG